MVRNEAPDPRTFKPSSTRFDSRVRASNLATGVHYGTKTVAQPLLGIENEYFAALMEIVYVEADPELYMHTASLPSGFLKAIASPPLVLTTDAPTWVYCEQWRKT
jgi:hypothetical protein